MPSLNSGTLERLEEICEVKFVSERQWIMIRPRTEKDGLFFLRLLVSHSAVLPHAKKSKVKCERFNFFKIEQCTMIEQVQVHLCFCTRPISLLRFAPSPLKGFVRLPIWVWSLIVLILLNLSSVKVQLIEIVLILLNLSSGWSQLKCHSDLSSSSHCFSSRWSQSCPHGCSLVWDWCCPAQASHLCRTSLSYYYY